MSDQVFYLSLVLSGAVLFLPFIVALFGRGGILKFLAFVLCLLTGFAWLFLPLLLGWLVAWIFAAVTLSGRRREWAEERRQRELVAAMRGR
jgi:hypothetical protein